MNKEYKIYRVVREVFIQTYEPLSDLEIRKKAVEILNRTPNEEALLVWEEVKE